MDNVRAFAPKNTIAPATDALANVSLRETWCQLLTCHHILAPDMVARSLRCLRHDNHDAIDAQQPWLAFDTFIQNQLRVVSAYCPLADSKVPLLTHACVALEADLRQYAAGTACYYLLRKLMPREAFTADDGRVEAVCASPAVAFNLLTLVDEYGPSALQDYIRTALTKLWHDGESVPFVTGHDGQTDTESDAETLFELQEALVQQAQGSMLCRVPTLDNAYPDLPGHIQREATLLTLWLALMQFSHAPPEFHAAMLQARQLFSKALLKQDPDVVYCG